MATIYDEASRTEAARIGGVILQIVRDRVVKFNAQRPEGLIDRKPPGQPFILSDAHRQHLSQMIDVGPIPAVHGVVRWWLVDLIQWLWEEYRLTISKQTLSRESRALNFRKLSACPRHHAMSEAAVAASKKTSLRTWRQSRSEARGRPVEIWFCDEARAGQKNKITRRWAKRGTRPSAPGDLRTQSAYILRAICADVGSSETLRGHVLVDAVSADTSKR